MQFYHVINVPISEQLSNAQNSMTETCTDESDLNTEYKWQIVGEFNYRLFESINKSIEWENSTEKLLNIGGDHSIAIGSIAALLKAYQDDLLVLWIDAHADINTPMDSKSKNLHGCPVALLMDLDDCRRIDGFDWMAKESIPILKPSQICYIGLRDVEDKEVAMLKKHNILYYSMTDVDKAGIHATIASAMEKLQPENANRKIHVSFDVDALDPQYAPSTGTPVRGGLTYREVRYAAEYIGRFGQLKSIDIVEINPEIGSSHEIQKTIGNSLDILKYFLGSKLV